MKVLIILSALILYLSYDNDLMVSASFFTNIISSNGYCEDSESITINKTINFLKIYDCRNIFPLKSAVYSFKIIHLILKANEITNLTKGGFRELVTVKKLEIIKNNLIQMEENALISLRRLTHLTIVEPELRLQNLILSNDCKLELLHLELQSFHPRMLSKLPKEMTNVTIENTPALSSELSIPNNFMNLKYLKLRNCSIDIWKESEATFSALEYLDISHNKLTEIPLMSEKYPKLLTLILSYNRISSIDERSFVSSRSLKILKLDNNKIHFVHPNAFSNIMSLAAVDLSHNSLEHISLNYTHLHKYQVDVKSNRISCGDLRFAPPYFKIDAIECIRKLYKVIQIISILFISCVSVILIRFTYRRRYQILHLLKNRGLPQVRPRNASVSDPADRKFFSFSSPNFFQGLRARDPQLRRHQTLRDFNLPNDSFL